MSTSRRKQGFLIYRRLTSETQTSVGCFVVSPQDQDQPKKKPMPQEGSSLMRISSTDSRHDDFLRRSFAISREFHRCHTGAHWAPLTQSGPATLPPCQRATPCRLPCAFHSNRRPCRSPHASSGFCSSSMNVMRRRRSWMKQNLDKFRQMYTGVCRSIVVRSRWLSFCVLQR